MKGLSFEIIGVIIIALVGIVMLMLFIKGTLFDFTKRTFCFFYRLISTEKTEWCETQSGVPRPIELYPDTIEDLARNLSAYSIMCWLEANKPLERKSVVCYQLMLKKHPGKVYEKDVTQILEDEDGCLDLQNALIINETGNLVQYSGDCGVEDQLKWDVSNHVVENQTLVLVKYDVDTKQIILKT